MADLEGLLHPPPLEIPETVVACLATTAGTEKSRETSQMSSSFLGVVRWAGVVLNPTPTALPGSGTLQNMANGLAGWGLILALVAVVLGAVTWALGSHSQNVHHAMNGRRAVLVAGGAALLIGAAPILINFFFQAGTGLH